MMEQERFNELVEKLRTADEGVHSVQITEEEIADLSRSQAEELVALYGSTTLMTLPRREREFFGWLRQQDEPVWNDLWGGDETPYRVSLAYLTDLLPNRRGFLICDLMEHQNYYFTVENITREDGAALLDAAMEIVKNEGRLTMEQAFMVEVWRAPIDQWRFAYMYRQPLEQVKQMVLSMISEGLLTLPQREEPEPDQSGSHEAS